MEDVVKMFSDVYKNRRVLVTGHTGFKGSWLSLWLTSLGAEVTGVALPFSEYNAHWNSISVDMKSFSVDIRDQFKIRQIIKDSKPEILFHLAAQPLVRRSYIDPIETWTTNVIGTVNLLDACKDLKELKAIVVVTTDKCYENQDWSWGYRENDRLGGHDPYSASKASAELVVSSFRDSFFNTRESTLIATARAGNVIGGGDWSDDRLIPDLMKIMQKGGQLEIRSPDSTRPWQHVLESVSGYLNLGQKLYEGNKKFADAWNFGPAREGNRKVQEVIKQIECRWQSVDWVISNKPQPHEAKLLYLDSTKSEHLLDWQPVWSFEETIDSTVEWYKAWIVSKKILSYEQLNKYIADANKKNLKWVKS